MDLDVAMRSLECPYTVHFYGAMFRDGDVWICMEVLFEFRITMKYLLYSFAGYGHLPRSPLQKHESSGQFYARVRTSPGLYIVLSLFEESNVNAFFLSGLCLQVSFSIVSALHYLHQQLRVIHRDVKPSNILVDKTGCVKLCDFGISAYLIDSIARTRDAGVIREAFICVLADFAC